MERSPAQRRRSNRQGDGPVSNWRTALIGPTGLALLLVVAGSLLHAQTAPHAVQGMLKASGHPANLTGGSTTEHELVLGTDGRHIVLLTTPEGAEGRPDWAKGVTRIAELQAGQDHLCARNMGARAHPGCGLVRRWESFTWTSTCFWHGGDMHWTEISLHLVERPPAGWAVDLWPVPPLEFWEGDAAFAMFDVQSGREGDLLVALRPNEAGSGHPHLR